MYGEASAPLRRWSRCFSAANAATEIRSEISLCADEESTAARLPSLESSSLCMVGCLCFARAGFINLTVLSPPQVYRECAVVHLSLTVQDTDSQGITLARPLRAIIQANLLIPAREPRTKGDAMSLTTAEMLRYLVGDELNVHGIYDDTKNIATYGIGVVVSQRYQWPSFLIMAAQSKEEWKQKFITRIGTKKKNKGRLIRAGQARLMSGTFFSAAKSDPQLTGALKEAAIVAAQDYIARHWYHKVFAEIPANASKRVAAEAARAVAAEIDILAKDPVQLATSKLSEYTRIVDSASKKIGVTLTDGQYLAVLSVCWNSQRDARHIIENTLRGYLERGM